jgi:glycosyltransferase involved in cell wall biosynthesis
LPPEARTLPLRLFAAGRPLRIAYARGLWSALREELPTTDVLHIHSLYLYPQLSAAWHAARLAVPYVVSIHGALDPYIRRRGRARKALVTALAQGRILDRAAALHVTADAEAALISGVASDTPREVIPAGLDVARFDGESDSFEHFRSERLAGHRGPVVLNVGRIAAKKGLDSLIRAFPSVLAEIRNAHLVIAGPDDEGLVPGLEALAAELGIARQVTFLGMLDRAGVVGALRCAQVWALPSHTENFGIAVVEAMAAGLPVVITPEVNIANDVSKAGAGIVTKGDPAAFAKAIVSLLSDERTRRAIGGRAREYARRYDWASIGPELVGMYQRAAAPGGSAGRASRR